jgi:hypothetical protein
MMGESEGAARGGGWRLEAAEEQIKGEEAARYHDII